MQTPGQDSAEIVKVLIPREVKPFHTGQSPSRPGDNAHRP